MGQGPMHRRYITAVVLSTMLLGGCGGGGGLSLSGGSIPPGTIKGFAVLPNAQTVTAAAVTARVISTTQSLTVNTTFNADGSFTVKGLPAATDVAVTLQDSAGHILRTIVPHTLIAAGSSTPVNIGNVTAPTTVVATALQAEGFFDPGRVQDVVTGQTAPLTQSVARQNFTQAQQFQIITDTSTLAQTVNTVIKDTANAELTQLAAAKDTATASLAVDGLSGDIRVRRVGSVKISSALRGQLIQKQVAGSSYTAGGLVSILSSIGVTVTEEAVAAADQSQRTQLPAFNALNARITPFEALAIVTSPTSAGGLQLSDVQTTAFITALVNRV